jgi:hypothetical protein
MTMLRLVSIILMWLKIAPTMGRKPTKTGTERFCRMLVTLKNTSSSQRLSSLHIFLIKCKMLEDRGELFL